MERLRIPVHAIAGTSMGSIIGALYASGMSPDEMEKALEEIDWIDALKDDPPRREFDYRKKEDDFLYGIKAELGFRKGKLVFPRGFIAREKLGFILRISGSGRRSAVRSRSRASGRTSSSARTPDSAGSSPTDLSAPAGRPGPSTSAARSRPGTLGRRRRTSSRASSGSPAASSSASTARSDRSPSASGSRTGGIPPSTC
jgi:hypothetical protein